MAEALGNHLQKIATNFSTQIVLSQLKNTLSFEGEHRSAEGKSTLQNIQL